MDMDMSLNEKHAQEKNECVKDIYETMCMAPENSKEENLRLTYEFEVEFLSEYKDSEYKKKKHYKKIAYQRVARFLQTLKRTFEKKNDFSREIPSYYVDVCELFKEEMNQLQEFNLLCGDHVAHLKGHAVCEVLREVTDTGTGSMTETRLKIIEVFLNVRGFFIDHIPGEIEHEKVMHLLKSHCEKTGIAQVWKPRDW